MRMCISCKYIYLLVTKKQKKAEAKVEATHEEPSKLESISPDSFLSAFFPCINNLLSINI